MMTGLYKDSEEKAIKTAEKIIALSPQTVRIYPTVVLKGTYLADLYLSGEYKPLNADESAQLCAKLVLLFEKKYACRRFSRQLWRACKVKNYG
mgnify:CR=1 FL=1